MLLKNVISGRFDTSYKNDKGLKMKLKTRNFMWVRNHAFDIGMSHTGVSEGWFTVGQVAEALGFSRTTVKKYVDMLIEDGAVEQIVSSKSLNIYRFTELYKSGLGADRLGTGKEA